MMIRQLMININDRIIIYCTEDELNIEYFPLTNDDWNWI